SDPCRPVVSALRGMCARQGIWYWPGNAAMRNRSISSDEGFLVGGGRPPPVGGVAPLLAQRGGHRPGPDLGTRVQAGGQVPCPGLFGQGPVLEARNRLILLRNT